MAEFPSEDLAKGLADKQREEQKKRVQGVDLSDPKIATLVSVASMPQTDPETRDNLLKAASIVQRVEGNKLSREHLTLERLGSTTQELARVLPKCDDPSDQEVVSRAIGGLMLAQETLEEVQANATDTPPSIATSPVGRRAFNSGVARTLMLLGIGSLVGSVIQKSNDDMQRQEEEGQLKQDLNDAVSVADQLGERLQIQESNTYVPGELPPPQEEVLPPTSIEETPTPFPTVAPNYGRRPSINPQVLRPTPTPVTEALGSNSTLPPQVTPERSGGG